LIALLHTWEGFSQGVPRKTWKASTICKEMTERMSFRIYSWLLLVLAILSTSIGSVSAAAINPAPQDIPTFCTIDPRWAAPGVLKEDCLATVDKLYDIEVKPRTKLYEKDDFEFLSPRMKETPGLESRSTPRKYTVGAFKAV